MVDVMHIETERKFLVKDLSFMDAARESHTLCQGYIAHDSGNTVRVRIQDSTGILTIKGRTLDGISRPEWEKEIPIADARALFSLCIGGKIEKTRYIVPEGKHKWEIDVFHGENDGLVMAEIELDSADEAFGRPAWLGEEVTGDKRYYNSYLTKVPFKEW